MATTWIDHVQKVKSTMPKDTLFKNVLKKASETWKKGIGAVTSATKSAKKTLSSVVSKGGTKKTRKSSKRKSSKRKSSKRKSSKRKSSKRKSSKRKRKSRKRK